MQTLLRFIDRDHAWPTAIFSMLFTILVVYSDEIINEDGILYVESARLFIEQGWSAGFDRYHWPFYSLLIAGLSKLLFIDLELAAYILNTLIFGLLGYVFIRCVEVMGGDRKVTLSAAILFLAHVSLNEFRDLIVRDFGYLAFSFTALLFLLKHKTDGLHRHAVGAGAAMIVAILFRVEGIVILTFMPLILFWRSGDIWKNIQSCLLVWMPAIILAIVAIAFAGLIFDAGNAVIGKLADFSQNFNKVLFSVTEGINDKAQVLVDHVLGRPARDMGTQGVIAIMIMLLLADLFSATGILVPTLIIWGMVKERSRINISQWSIPVWLVILNLIILAGFVVGRFFLTGRYALYFSLLLSLLAAFPLAKILFFDDTNYDSQKVKKAKFIRVMLIIIFIYMIGDGLTSSSDKQYRLDAAQWLNTHADKASILANDTHMYYYTGRFVPNKKINGRNNVSSFKRAMRKGEIPDIDVEKYDYLVFRIGRKQKGYKEKLIAWIGREPAYVTANKRNDSVIIFDLRLLK